MCVCICVLCYVYVSVLSYRIECPHGKKQQVLWKKIFPEQKWENKTQEKTIKEDYFFSNQKH